MCVWLEISDRLKDEPAAGISAAGLPRGYGEVFWNEVICLGIVLRKLLDDG